MKILEKQDTLDSFYVWKLNQILNLKNQKPMNEKFYLRLQNIYGFKRNSLQHEIMLLFLIFI